MSAESARRGNFLGDVAGHFLHETEAKLASALEVVYLDGSSMVAERLEETCLMFAAGWCATASVSLCVVSSPRSPVLASGNYSAMALNRTKKIPFCSTYYRFAR